MADQREVLKSLLVKLNATGLAKRDQVLYDFLRNLFVGVDGIDKALAIIEAAGSSVINNTTIIQQFLNLLSSDSGDGDGSLIPGPPGAAGSTGSTGSQGPIGPATYLANNDYSEDLLILGFPTIPSGSSGSGTVTNVATDGIYLTGGPITTTGTISPTTLTQSSVDSAQHTLLGGI